MLHVIILPTCIYNFYKQSYNHLHMYNESCFCINSFTLCSPFITHLLYNTGLDITWSCYGSQISFIMEINIDLDITRSCYGSQISFIMEFNMGLDITRSCYGSQNSFNMEFNMGFEYNAVMLWFPKFFSYGNLQRNRRIIKWSFSYDSFVKLSLFNTIHS